MSVTAASGTRIPHAKLQRLEVAGLVVRDTGHPVHAGQPVALTDAGRAALFAARRTPTTQAPKPGAWHIAVHPSAAALNPTERPLLSPTEPAPARKSIPQVDFELDDFDADEEKYLDFYRQVAVREDMLVPLAEHHTPTARTATTSSSTAPPPTGTRACRSTSPCT